MTRKPTQDFFLFLLGSGMFAAGIFLFTSQVTVGSGYGLGRGLAGRYGGGFGSLFGFGGFLPMGAGRGFGLLMIPFTAGVALLLADSLRRLGWFLIWAASAALAAGILQSLLFNFRPASLWSLLAMMFMVGGGAGLMFRSLRGYPEEEGPREVPDRHRDAEDRNEIRELREELERLKARVSRDDLTPRG